MRHFVRILLTAGVALALGQSAFAQRGGGGGAQPGGGGGGGANFAMQIALGTGLKARLLDNKALQEELKVTDEQKDKIKKYAEKITEARAPMGGAAPGGGGGGGRPMGGGGGGGFGGGAGGFGGFGGGAGGFPAAASDEDQVERLKTQIKTLEERIAFFKATLSADQLKRIAQIEVQQMGMGAFTNAKITTELKITDEQKEKIKTVNDEFAKENADLLKEYGMGGGGAGGGRPMGGGGGGGGGGAARPDPEKLAEYGKKAKALREEALEKIEKALAADQKKVWKEMIGTSFDLTKLTVRPMTDN